MAKNVKVQYLGSDVYRGADEFTSSSLTVEPGDVVEISGEKYEELHKDDQHGAIWKVVYAKGAKPVAAATAMSSQNTPTK
jgi:hypothetical protein